MPARSTRVRTIALALAGAVNLLLVLLLLSSRHRSAMEQVVTAMIWLTPPREVLAPTLPPEQPRSEPAERLPSPIAESQESEPRNAITLPPRAIPPIDWYAEAEITVRNAVPDIARLKPAPSLDSKPNALVLPDRNNVPHKAGDSEHREGGETITWINETCYISNKPSSILFNPVPGLILPTCKVRSMSERASEKAAQEMLKETKPGYLRKEPPESEVFRP